METEGMLLHPQIGSAVDESVRIQGHILRFKTLDLRAKPADFERSLIGLI
jgi:5-methylcytosine-specific restriction enzyme subunit McrC